MANTVTIQQLRSNQPGQVPESSALLEGQLAINLPDRILYTKQANGAVVALTSKGDKGDIGVGEKGDQGDKGDQGERGLTPAAATIEFLEDQDNYRINFVYPDGNSSELIWPLERMIGPTGEKGNPGLQGEKGEKGEVGDKGDGGSKGDVGSPGGVSLGYLFSANTNTSVDPTQSYLRFNSSTFTDVTEVTLHHLDFYDADVGALIGTFDNSTSTIRGFLRVHESTDPSNFLIFVVNGNNTLGLQFSTVSVEFIAGTATTFENETSLILTFTPSGDGGAQGEKGEPGAQGVDGSIGVDGEKGEKGDKGVDGSIGTNGEKGQKGEAIANVYYEASNNTLVVSITDNTEYYFSEVKGEKGVDGEKGVKGERVNNVVYTQANDTLRFVSSDLSAYDVTGIRGPKGEIGQKGIAGEAASKGEQGDKGEIGDKGDQGEKGNQGATGTTGDKGEAGAKGEVGDKGQQGETGPQGQTGSFGGATFEYTFSNQTGNADPGVGNLRLNNATLSSVTRMYIDDADVNGTDIQSFLRTIDDSTSAIKGHFKIARKNDPTAYAMFAITALVIENDGYFNVTTGYVTGSLTSFTNEDELTITFARTGDIGDTGPKGDKGDQGIQGVKGERVLSAEYDDINNRIVFTNSGATPTTFDVTGVKGQKGVKGDQGIVGDKGQKGQKGELVESASYDRDTDTITFVNTDDSEFTVSGVKGDVGPQGNKGQKGERILKGEYTDANNTTTFTSTDGTTFDITGIKGDKGQKGDVGQKGQKGASVQFVFNFNTTTSIADPGNGYVSVDNELPDYATQLLISDLDLYGTNALPFIETFNLSSNESKGTLVLRSAASPSKFVMYYVQGTTDHAGYTGFDIEYITGSGLFNLAEPLLLDFIQAGDKGEKGERVLSATYSEPLGVGSRITFTNSDTSTFSVDGVKGQKGDRLDGAVYYDANNTTTFTNTDESTFDVVGLKGQQGQKGERILSSSYNEELNRITFTNTDGSDFTVDGVKGQKGDRILDATFYDANNTTTFTNSDSTEFDVNGLKGQKGDKGQKGEIGVKGEVGSFGGAAFDYTFTTDTVAGNPGNGFVKMDDVPGDATTLYISKTDDGSTDVTTFLQTIDDSTNPIKGHFTIRLKADATVFALYAIVGELTENAEHIEVPVAFVSGSYTAPNDNDDVIITFARTGDVGAKGSQGEKGQKGERIASASFNNALNTTTFTNSDTSTFTVSGLKGQKGERIDSADFDGDNTTTFNNSDGSTFELTGLKGQKGQKGERILKGEYDGDNTITFTNTDDTTYTVTGLKGEKGAQVETAEFYDANNTTRFTNSDGSTVDLNGLKGQKGQKGERTTKGEYDGDNTITFTNSDGSTYDVYGTKGEKGAQVTTAQYYDGNNTTRFTNSDTSTFVINGLKGQKGIKGEIGEKGEQVASASYDDLTNTTTFTNSDNSTFTIEGVKGQKGQQGDKGEQGDKGTVGDTGLTGDKGDQGQKGEKGEIGEKGYEGDNSATSINYYFSTTTLDTDPGSGYMRFDSPVFTAVTTLRLDLFDRMGTNVTAFLNALDDSTTTTNRGSIRIAAKNDQTKFVLFTITSSSVDMTGYYNLGVSWVLGSATSFLNNQEVVLSFVRSGDKGQKGATGDTGLTGVKGDQGSKGDKGEIGSKGETGNFGGATFAYQFDTSTADAYPGIGLLRFNNVDVTLATYLYISDSDTNATNIDSFLRTIDDSTSSIRGHFTVSNKNDGTAYALFAIPSNITEISNYYKVPVSFVSGSSTSFSLNDDITITFARTGDIGDQGPQGDKGDQGPKGEKGTYLVSASYESSNDTVTFVNSDTSSFDLSGIKGDTGEKGEKGITGTTGDTGSKGEKGEIGQKGVAGDKGQKGEAGDTGAQGDKGDQGIKGQKGDSGDKGQKGELGTKGERIASATYDDLTNTTTFTNTDESSFDLVGIKGQKGQPAEVSPFVINHFTGDGATTQFTLSSGFFTADQLLVTVDGVVHKPTTHYSLSGTTLTFEVAPYNLSKISVRSLVNLGDKGDKGEAPTSFTDVAYVSEVLQTKTGATGTVVHDTSQGSIFLHSNITGNFTANFTNVPTTTNRATGASLILSQGIIPYICNAVQVNGTAATINWLNNEAPAGTSNKKDVITFTIIRVSSSWIVIGQLASYG